MQHFGEVLVPFDLSAVDDLTGERRTPERPEDLADVVVQELLLEMSLLLFCSNEGELEFPDFLKSE
jgi:hypothetical protein